MTNQSNSTVRILQLNGRFDAFEAADVAAQLDELMIGESPRVIVNMANVVFIDSAALATLIKAMKRARQRNGDCRLCALQPQVQVIFELTRLNQAFEIFKDEYTAIQSFREMPAYASDSAPVAGQLRWGTRA